MRASREIQRFAMQSVQASSSCLLKGGRGAVLCHSNYEKQHASPSTVRLIGGNYKCALALDAQRCSMRSGILAVEIASGDERRQRRWLDGSECCAYDKHELAAHEAYKHEQETLKTREKTCKRCEQDALEACN